MNAMKKISLEHFNNLPTTPRVDFKGPNLNRDVAALNALNFPFCFNLSYWICDFDVPDLKFKLQL